MNSDSASARFDELTKTVARLDELTRTVARFEAKLDSVIAALGVLGRLEERQEYLGGRVLESSETVSLLEQRIAAIERELPALVETRKWVIAGVLGGISMMGLGLAKLVLASN